MGDSGFLQEACKRGGEGVTPPQSAVRQEEALSCGSGSWARCWAALPELRALAVDCGLRPRTALSRERCWELLGAKWGVKGRSPRSPGPPLVGLSLSPPGCPGGAGAGAGARLGLGAGEAQLLAWSGRVIPGPGDLLPC